MGAPGIDVLEREHVVGLVNDLRIELLRRRSCRTDSRPRLPPALVSTRTPDDRPRPRCGRGSRRPSSRHLERRPSRPEALGPRTRPARSRPSVPSRRRRRRRSARPRRAPRAVRRDGSRNRARISLPRSIRRLERSFLTCGGPRRACRPPPSRAEPSTGTHGASRTGGRARHPSSARTPPPISPGKPTMMSVARARPGSASFARLSASLRSPRCGTAGSSQRRTPGSPDCRGTWR